MERIYSPEEQKPCPACCFYGGYCGGEKHPSCGCFDKQGRPCSLKDYEEEKQSS